jgi:hypothetical protein
MRRREPVKEQCTCGEMVTGKRGTINHGEIAVIRFKCWCRNEWETFDGQ